MENQNKETDEQADQLGEMIASHVDDQRPEKPEKIEPEVKVIFNNVF